MSGHETFFASKTFLRTFRSLSHFGTGNRPLPCWLHGVLPWILNGPRTGLTGPLVAVLLSFFLTGCASLMGKVTEGLAADLSAAILAQNDPETVRDGVPAYLLMLDSFVAGNPDDPAMLSAASELYAAYGAAFVSDPERSKRLTRRAFDYGERALCASTTDGCGLGAIPARELPRRLDILDAGQVGVLYTFGLSWLSYIQAHADEPSALSDLPRATLVLERVRDMNPAYRPAQVQLYLAVLHTIRPPALGGDFEAGRRHFDQAWRLSGRRDLNVKVKFARFYARALYDRELHDETLREVLEAEADQPGLTLSNTLAQREAEALLDSADDYF